jgi:hypothetical protein
MTAVFGKRPAGSMRSESSQPTGGAGPHALGGAPPIADRGRQAANPRIQDWIAWLALAMLGAGVAFYVWRVILEVPFERPLAALFENQRQQVGWAPWWVAPLVAAFVSALIAKALVRRPGTISLRGMVVRAASAAYAGAVCARVVRNLGYVLLFVPGADWLNAMAVLPQMVALHLVQSASLLMLPKGLPIAVIAPAVGVLLWLVRHPGRPAAVHPQQPAAVGPETVQLMPATGSELMVSKLTRTISMVAFAILVSLPVLYSIGPFIIVSMVTNAYVWRTFALPERRFVFARVLTVGALSATALNCLALVLIGGGFSPARTAMFLAQALLLTAIVSWAVWARAAKASNGIPVSTI